MTMAGSPADVTTRALHLLERWRRGLDLSPRESSGLGDDLAAVDRQLRRLVLRRLRIVACGRVGVGKSSLLNALLQRQHFATDVAHGSTQHQQGETWQLPEPIPGVAAIDLVDTPGLDAAAAASHARRARRAAAAADLVLFVLAGDVSAPEALALEQLRCCGKPVLLVLNRIDTWNPDQLPALLQAVARRAAPLLGDAALHPQPLAVAAAPRQPVLLPDGRVRSEATAAHVQPLLDTLLQILQTDGANLLARNSLLAADRFTMLLRQQRFQQRRGRAQQLIGRYAVMKAAGLAANPLILVDLAGAATADIALVLQLADLYGIRLTRLQAQALLRQLGGNLCWVAGVQLTLQGLLGVVKQGLMAAAPFTAGLSLAPAGPVALAQATLAVRTTRTLGRLTARKLLAAEGGDGTASSRPGVLLQRFIRGSNSRTRGAWASTGDHESGDPVEATPLP